MGQLLDRAAGAGRPVERRSTWGGDPKEASSVGQIGKRQRGRPCKPRHRHGRRRGGRQRGAAEILARQAGRRLVGQAGRAPGGLDGGPPEVARRSPAVAMSEVRDPVRREKNHHQESCERAELPHEPTSRSGVAGAGETHGRMPATRRVTRSMVSDRYREPGSGKLTAPLDGDPNSSEWLKCCWNPPRATRNGGAVEWQGPQHARRDRPMSSDGCAEEAKAS
jgi:hypothetical protein